MREPNRKGYLAATLALMAATSTVTYWIVHETEAPSGESTPSDATCVAYMEADRRYETRQSERVPNAAFDAAASELGLTDPLEAERREAYLQAYRGARSADPVVMTRLLNADRWRCCKRLEPNRRVCPVAQL